MSNLNLLSPLQQLEDLEHASESGIIDRIAAHQAIAIPHWVEVREGCLVGRYSSLMPLQEMVAEIQRWEASGELSSAGLELLVGLRESAKDPKFWPDHATVDEKVATALLATADPDDVDYGPVGPTILTDFLGLHARTSLAIERFARRFGTLQTFSKGSLPTTTLSDTSLWDRHYTALPQTIHEEIDQNAVDVYEPIAYWEAFSRFAFLTLKLAGQLDDVAFKDKEVVPLEDWVFFTSFLRRQSARGASALPGELSGASPFLSTGSKAALRSTFCDVLNELQDIGHVKLELRWDRSPPKLEFRVIGLVSVIASQLLMAASQRQNFVLCRECLGAFRPWQQPRTGKVDLYCSKCREAQAPQRNATQRYRTTEKYRETLRRAKLKRNRQI